MASLRMTLLDLLNKSEQGADPNFLRDGVQLLAQELRDAEVTDLVGAEPINARPAGPPTARAIDNGSGTPRVGTLELQIPKLRQGIYFPSLLRSWPSDRHHSSPGGVGVSLDMSIPVGGVKGLLELLQYLTEVGWGHPDAQWSIEQSGRSWHGFGGTALADALSHWKERYQDLGQPHHTEVKCADGFYTLKADIGATARREVWPCDLSFQLRGTPLDPEPFRALASAFKVDATGHWFRPRTEKSVLRTHLDGRTLELSPLALVVQTENPGARRKPLQWVVGIVTANPFKGRRGRGEKAPEHWPSTLEDSDALICSLGSWHFLGDQVRYHMRWCDSAWSSDIQVISPSADWRDTVRRTRSARESRIVVTVPLAKPKAVRRPRSQGSRASSSI